MRYDGNNPAAGLKLGSFQRRFAMFFMCRNQLEQEKDRAFIEELHEEVCAIGEAMERTVTRDRKLWELQRRVGVIFDPFNEQSRLLSEVAQFKARTGKTGMLEPGLAVMLSLLTSFGRDRQLSRAELCQLQFVLLCTQVQSSPER